MDIPLSPDGAAGFLLGVVALIALWRAVVLWRKGVVAGIIAYNAILAVILGIVWVEEFIPSIPLHIWEIELMFYLFFCVAIVGTTNLISRLF